MARFSRMFRGRTETVDNNETHAVSVGAAQEVTVGGSSLHGHTQSDVESAP